MTQTRQKCGFVGIIGRPNAGKSTLLNGIIGRKLAGVSLKPQTTRRRIVGIKMVESCQILFVDTPGMHRDNEKKPLNSMLNKEAWASVADADVLLYLVDVENWRNFLHNLFLFRNFWIIPNRFQDR